jgi:hypothetical protein
MKTKPKYKKIRVICRICKLLPAALIPGRIFSTRDPQSENKTIRTYYTPG